MPLDLISIPILKPARSETPGSDLTPFDVGFSVIIQPIIKGATEAGKKKQDD
jgi:hypothetical protein